MGARMLRSPIVCMRNRARAKETCIIFAPVRRKELQKLNASENCPHLGIPERCPLTLAKFDPFIVQHTEFRHAFRVRCASTFFFKCPACDLFSTGGCNFMKLATLRFFLAPPQCCLKILISARLLNHQLETILKLGRGYWKCELLRRPRG